MKRLTPEQTAILKPWFRPERPGPLIGSHVIHTGNGTCLVDRWPEPRVVLVETAGNYTLLGDAQAITPADVQPHIKGFVEASTTFEPLLRTAFPVVGVWQRVVYAQQAISPLYLAAATSNDYVVRRLGASDAQYLGRLSDEIAWISKTWGGPESLAASGFSWGAFVSEQLAAVACTFFLGETYEEIGVATEPPFRGFGLSTVCAWELCRDMRARGHQLSWTTSLDNQASIRVAEKLGCAVHHYDQLYVVGISTPEPAHPGTDA